jgi:hypothetical protein
MIINNSLIFGLGFPFAQMSACLEWYLPELKTAMQRFLGCQSFIMTGDLFFQPPSATVPAVFASS